MVVLCTLFCTLYSYSVLCIIEAVRWVEDKNGSGGEGGREREYGVRCTEYAVENWAVAGGWQG